MPSPPQVSVILPTYNRAALLPRAMRSVLAQTYDDLELIVVDDASSDDTAEVIGQFEDPRIRFLRHESNRGGSAARNTGIEAARGRYIAFQDSDDEWMLDKLSRQVAAMDEAGESVGVVYCSYLRCMEKAAVYVPEPHVRRREGNLLPEILLHNFVGTPTLLVRRECLEAAGLFLEGLPRFQDWELVIRLARACRFRLLEEPLVIAHFSAGNTSSNDAAASTAMDMILERHGAALREDPRVLANFLGIAGHYKFLNVSRSAGRAQLFGALRADPRNLKVLAALLLSLFGRGVYRAVHSLSPG